MPESPTKCNKLSINSSPEVNSGLSFTTSDARPTSFSPIYAPWNLCPACPPFSFQPLRKQLVGGPDTHRVENTQPVVWKRRRELDTQIHPSSPRPFSRNDCTPSAPRNPSGFVWDTSTDVVPLRCYPVDTGAVSRGSLHGKRYRTKKRSQIRQGPVVAQAIPRHRRCCLPLWHIESPPWTVPLLARPRTTRQQAPGTSWNNGHQTDFIPQHPPRVAGQSSPILTQLRLPSTYRCKDLNISRLARPYRFRGDGRQHGDGWQRPSTYAAAAAAAAAAEQWSEAAAPTCLHHASPEHPRRTTRRMANRHANQRQTRQGCHSVRLPPLHCRLCYVSCSNENPSITNLMLAMPAADWKQAAKWGIDFERKTFMGTSDRVRPPDDAIAVIDHLYSQLHRCRTTK